jgi:hypothetical protein
MFEDEARFGRMGEVILCNDCTFFALKSGRLAVVKMTFMVPASAAGDRWKTEVLFCVKITQNEVIFRPCLCRMKKSSSECISCITYIFEGKNSGRLAGMTVITRNSNTFPHRQAFAVADGPSRTFADTGMKWRCRKNPEEQFITSTRPLSPRRFCKVCKLIPPVFARVPAMTKIIANRSTLPKTKTPMRSMALPGFHYGQRLNLYRPDCRQAASRKKSGFIFDSSRTCRKNRGEFRVPTTPLTIRLRVK